jgi:hypothetical protein
MAWCLVKLRDNFIPFYFLGPNLFISVQGYLSGTALGYGLDDTVFASRRGMGIFLFTMTYRPVLELTHPPIHWVPGALSLCVKRPWREADHSPPSSAEVKE